MATYAELYTLRSNSDLRNKVRIAVMVAAETIRTEDSGTVNHANRLVWAKTVFQSPDSLADQLFPAVLATNKGQSVVDIEGASDAVIQANVDAAVDLFAIG